MIFEELKRVVLSDLRRYIRDYYLNEGFSRDYFLGHFRGYIHALGALGQISRSSEHRLCSQNFLDFKRSQVSLLFLSWINDALNSKYNGERSENDDLFDIIYEE